jgi:GTP-binding protein
VSLRQYRQQLRDLLPYAGFLPLVLFSALTGKDLDRLLQTCEYVIAQRERKIQTPVLNKVLQVAQKQTPISAKDGKRLKILYAVQTGASPPVFRLFVNHPRLLPAAGRGYLTNQLRRALGFEGVPIKLDLRPAPPAGNKQSVVKATEVPRI